MKVLQVIHGYPMRYNAGSEVYTQTLCHGLVRRGHEVHVFTREEDSFAPDYHMRHERDLDEERVHLHVVNVPRSRDRYRHDGVDARFAELMDSLQPDIVHIGHLNHLSTSLVREASVRGTPIVYTLHDFWLMCPRGQFMQMHPSPSGELWASCDGQHDETCARQCYARYFSGAQHERQADLAYWTDWVKRRMAHVREMVEHVDRFLAPARSLMARYVDDFGLPPAKVAYLDYGFATERFEGRERTPDEPFTFGYIGTHIPAKGIDRLIQAFGRLEGSPRLIIWGRDRGQDTKALRALANALPDDAPSRISWRSEYRNADIVRDVFNHVDAIVVSSIWPENSPLVIHEAQAVRIPVVTSDVGGMAEYVHHEHNGLQFEHRDAVSLATQMQRLVDDPEWARTLGSRGYPYSEDGRIPDLEEHVVHIEDHYRDLLQRRDASRVEHRDGPWRITFDTNPDTCNLQCVMCEEHSTHSDRQRRRIREGRPRRVMPLELLERVIVEGVQHGLREVIPSTMGEPLLYEHMDAIIDLCTAHGVLLNLTTNGTFPRRGARAWAERLVPITSDIKISWNGATAGTHEAIMKGSTWETALDNVRQFIEVRDAYRGHRCRVTLQLTFLERNVDELADIVRLARSLGVDRVKGHHLWAHFDAIAEQSMRRSPEAIERWNRAVADARAAVREAPLPNGEYVLLDNIFPLDATATEDLAPDGACPFLGQEAWVSAQGRFDPCCAPDAQRRTLGSFGSLHDRTLQEVWTGSAYQRLVRGYRTRSLCRGCNMRRPTDAE